RRTGQRECDRKVRGGFGKFHADRNLFGNAGGRTSLFRPEQRARRGAGVSGATAPDTPARLITTITHGDADRVRSYELLAEVWQCG
ncbi:hypothetical protein ABZT10_26840, partial [Streptomyces sp900116325]